MGLGLKGKILIGVMACCLVGGVGSTLALTRNGATGNATTGAFDQAIYLYWDSESTTKVLADCDSLSAGVPVYRYLTVSPKSTKTVAGNVTLNFTLAQADGDFHLSGLTISVYKTASLATDLTVEGLITDVDPEPTLDSGHLTGSTSFAVTTSENVHETQAFYAIKVLYDGTYVADKTLGGSLTIAQSFSA